VTNSSGGSNSKPDRKKRKTDAFCKQFETWWQTYPRKAGKGKAYDAWAAAGRRIKAARKLDSSGVASFLLDRASAFADTPNGQDPKFCPYPATWLNQARYDDDPKCWEYVGNGQPAQSGPVESEE
jgi:hypothetical protein